jgi:hypothetical protein
MGDDERRGGDGGDTAVVVSGFVQLLQSRLYFEEVLEGLHDRVFPKLKDVSPAGLFGVEETKSNAVKHKRVNRLKRPN